VKLRAIVETFEAHSKLITSADRDLGFSPTDDSPLPRRGDTPNSGHCEPTGQGDQKRARTASHDRRTSRQREVYLGSVILGTIAVSTTQAPIREIFHKVGRGVKCEPDRRQGGNDRMGGITTSE
jgi:hypothetical protein